MKLYCKQNGYVSCYVETHNFEGTGISLYNSSIIDYSDCLTIGKKYYCEQSYNESSNFLVQDDNGNITNIPMELFTSKKECVIYDYNIEEHRKKLKKNYEDEIKLIRNYSNKRLEEDEGKNCVGKRGFSLYNIIKHLFIV